MATTSSKQYSWNDISVAFGGRVEDGVNEVEYTVKQDKDVLRGRGNKPYQILKGNKDFEGKINIWQSTLEAMIKSAPNKDILALEFDVVWAFTPTDGGDTVIDVLVGCQVKEYKKSMKQGDKNMMVELPFVFLDIKHQQ
jgi:hypothetical protein